MCYIYIYMYIYTHLGILLVIVLLCADPSRHQVVLDAVREGEEVVADRGYIPVFHQSVVKVSVKGLLEVGNVLDVDDPAHRDLLPLLVIAVRH